MVIREAAPSNPDITNHNHIEYCKFGKLARYIYRLARSVKGAAEICITMGVKEYLILEPIPEGKMFNVSNKRRQHQVADDMMVMAHQAAEEVKQKWLSFDDDTLPFKNGVSLSKKIDLFIEPVLGFFEKKYPVLLLGGGSVFWFTIATAILKSGTHSKKEVTEAFEGLKKPMAAN